MIDNQPRFTRHHDGRITVDRWTPEILIARELFATPCEGMTVADGSVLFRVANGQAKYRIAKEGPYEIACELLSSFLEY